MSELIDKIKNSLIELKSDYGMLGIKSELETEGADFEDIRILKSLADSIGTDLVVKIGGCEAVNDLIQLKQFGIKSIVAPMIESDYAVKKFITAITRIYAPEEISNMKLYINIETISGYKMLKEICKVASGGNLSGIVLGRTDMAGSMHLPGEKINGDEMLNIASEIKCAANNFGLDFIIGGGISLDTEKFLKGLQNLKMFETRKVLFDYGVLSENGYAKAITRAIEFEILWLEYLLNSGKSLELKYQNRISQLKKRLLCSMS